jgi:hypothetical protein
MSKFVKNNKIFYKNCIVKLMNFKNCAKIVKFEKLSNNISKNSKKSKIYFLTVIKILISMLKNFISIATTKIFPFFITHCIL